MKTHYDTYSQVNYYRRRGEYFKLLKEISQDKWVAVLEKAVLEAQYEPTPTKADAIVSLLMAMIDRFLENQQDQYSFTELKSNPLFKRLLDYFYNTVGSQAANLQTSILLAYHMVSHERAGKRVYQVSSGLAEQLKHTELRGLLTDDLRLPYENIAIQVPESLGFKVWNSDTGWHKLTDIYVTEDTSFEPDGRGWRVIVAGESKSGVVGDDALAHFWISLPKGKKLDDELKTLAKEIDREKLYDAGFGKMVDKWHEIFLWVMNVVLYATWSDPGERIMANKEARQLWARIQKMPKTKRKRKSLLLSFQKVNQQRRILLGKNVVVSRKLSGIHESDADSQLSGKPLEQAWVRTRVSGHWKNQPHGPRNSLRKLIFVAPYWKGPEDAPINTPGHKLV